jgi:hypothetical protein
MPKNTRLPGHTLRQEGGPFVRDRTTGGWYHDLGGWKGVGLCSCGATSEVVDSNNARKRWHAAHKQEIREQAASPDSSQEG